MPLIHSSEKPSVKACGNMSPVEQQPACNPEEHESDEVIASPVYHSLSFKAPQLRRKASRTNDCADESHLNSDVAAALENVCMAFGPYEALHRVSATIRKGTVTAIVGPNGSGKSTLLEILARLKRPTLGRLCYHDCPKIALLEQSVETDFWMPMLVKNVIAMGRYGADKMFTRLTRADRDIIQAAAQRMDVADLLNRQVKELSIGQQRRVRFAMCLAQQADLLLLDEPEAGLDVTSRQRIFDVMAAENERGATVVFTTHSFKEAGRADQVLLLNRKVIALGTPEEVLAQATLSSVFGDDEHGDGDGHGHDHDHGTDAEARVEVGAEVAAVR